MDRLLLILLCMSAIVSPFKTYADTKNTIEFRTAAFFHESEKVRRIYDSVSLDYQFITTVALTRNLELWGEIDYSKLSKNRDCFYTKLRLTSFSLGVQYVHGFTEKLDGYIGLGLRACPKTLISP